MLVFAIIESQKRLVVERVAGALAMNDPHVVSLTYRVQHSKAVDFERAAPLCVDQGAFRITLDNHKATVEMVDHYSSADEARKLVEPYLRAWQFVADLHDPSDAFGFKYDTAAVVDRDPPQSGQIVAAIGQISAAAYARAEAAIHVSRVAWPEPPQDLKLSFDADAMRRRWVRCCERGEPLLAAAYWALTMVEGAPGVAIPSKRLGKKRQAASAHFNIDSDVLNKLAQLVSTRGGDEEARKAAGKTIPLSPAEKRWVKATFRELVRRVAQREHYGGPPPRPLTMADLPSLMS